MPHILVQIAPQRSTLYSNIAGILAPIELASSPLSQSISSIEKVELGQQRYLKFSIDGNV